MKTRFTSFLLSIKNRFHGNRSQKKFNGLDQKLVLNLSKKSILAIPSLKQLKHINKFMSSKETMIVKALISVIFLNIIFIGTYQFITKSNTVATQGGEYSEALIGKPQLINPVLAVTNHVDNDLSSLIYSGLLKYDKNLNLVVDNASAYNISEDQKTYTFHLKNNIKWHDNELLTADDVVFTMSLIQDPSYNSPLRINFDGVIIEKIDEFTVKFTLNEPYAPFLDSLRVGILPEHLWHNVPSSYFSLAEYNNKPIGSGPYQFESLIKDKNGIIRSMTLKASENYHGIKPFINTLTFKFYPDFESAIDALKNKNVQGISKLPRESYEQISSSQKFNIHEFALPQYTALFFNLNKDTVWKNEELRKALVHGLNKQELLETKLKNYGKGIEGPILPGFLGFDEKKETYNYDTQKATDIFTKEEWIHNETTGFLTKDKKALQLTLTTINKYEHITVAEFLAAQWKSLGIDVQIELLASSELLTRIKDRDYETLLYGQLIGSDSDPYPFWHSTQRLNPGLNLSMFADKKVDEMIEEARKINNPDKRAQLYMDFNDEIVKSIPAIFLYTPTYNYAIDKNIKNVEGGRIVQPSDRFKTLTQWFIKTKRIWK